MKSKKRLIIAFSISATLIVGLTIALISVLAAFTATTSGGTFSVSYTAYHVNATITAAHQAPGKSSFTNLNVQGTTSPNMIFSSSEVSSKTFDAGINLQFTRQNMVAYLRYSIANTGSGPITVTKSFSVSSDDNVTVQYVKTTSSSLPSSGWTSANSALTDGSTINANTTIYLFVKIALKDNTKSIADGFSCSHNFSLAALDAN